MRFFARHLRRAARRDLVPAALLSILVALCLPTELRADRSVEVYLPQHRTAADLLPVASAALAGEGQATVDAGSNAIVLVGTPSGVRRALDLLAGRDIARKMIVIHYEVRDSRDFATSGIAVEWDFGVGIGVGRIGRLRGGKMYRSRSESRTGGEIRILDGEEGYVGQGREIPLKLRDRFGTSTVAMARAQSGLTARPQVLGDGRIQLDLRRTVESVDASGNLDFAETTTTVIVRSGETIAIAASSQQSHSASRPGTSISTRTLRDRERNKVYLLTASVLSN